MVGRPGGAPCQVEGVTCWGRGLGKEGAGWLSWCLSLGGAHGPNLFIDQCRHILSLLWKKCSHDSGGARFGGAGSGGDKQAFYFCLGLSTTFSEQPRDLHLGLGDPEQVTHTLWASVFPYVKSEGCTG